MKNRLGPLNTFSLTKIWKGYSSSCGRSTKTLKEKRFYIKVCPARPVPFLQESDITRILKESRETKVKQEKEIYHRRIDVQRCWKTKQEMATNGMHNGRPYPY